MRPIEGHHINIGGSRVEFSELVKDPSLMSVFLTQENWLPRVGGAYRRQNDEVMRREIGPSPETIEGLYPDRLPINHRFGGRVGRTRRITLKNQRKK